LVPLPGAELPCVTPHESGQRAGLEPAEHRECLSHGSEARIALASIQNAADLGANGPRIGHEHAVRNIVVVAPNDSGHKSKSCPNYVRAAETSATPSANDQALSLSDDKVFRKRIERL